VCGRTARTVREGGTGEVETQTRWITRTRRETAGIEPIRRTGHTEPVPYFTTPSAMDVNLLITKRVIFSGHQEITPMVTVQHVIRRASLGLSVLALMTTTLADPANAQVVVPSGGVVDVTGYSQVAPYGSLGPVIMVVKGKRAAAIRSALAGLSPTSSLPDCMETENAFTISFRTHQRGRPTMWQLRTIAQPQAL